MKLSPRSIASAPSLHNKGAFKWSQHGFIAYGACNMVAVVCSKSMQHITSLYAHRSPVTKIAWAPYSLPVDEEVEPVYLASADTSGYIVLFDVSSGKAKQRMSDGNKVVNAMEMFYANTIELYLLTLHQPGTLVLWNPKTGDQIWKRPFNDSLSSLSRDPFSTKHMILNGGTFLQHIKDFSVNQMPTDGSKLYLQPGSMLNESTSSPQNSSGDRKSKLNSAGQDSKRLFLGDNRTGAGGDDLLSSLQSVSYHKTRRNTLILIYNQDILLLDLDIRQTIASISLDRSTCPFVDVYACWSRDAMYCLHENGALVLRVKKPSLPNVEMYDEDSAPLSPKLPEYLYESHCSSDSMRITKNNKIYGLSVCPTSEMKAAVLASDGKLIIWELQGPCRFEQEHLSVERPVVALSDILNPSSSGCMVPPGVKCSFLITGITNALPQPPYIIKMCPPLTTKNFPSYNPYMAIGAVNGQIQVYNCQTGQLVRDISVHNSQIRGIEWASLHSLITHAFDSTTNPQAKSELAFVNIKTGRVTNFRQPKPDEGIIQAVRISSLRQYLVIIFKHKPMELWELKTLTLLREMSSDFPVITALEWSPNVKRKPPTEDKSTHQMSSHHMVKEHFVLTDNTGMLYHYIVEGSMVKDGSRINAEGVTGTVSSIAWKSDLLLLGDVNSNLSFWDLKAKKSRSFNAGKGMVRKIKFAPGKDNPKVVILFNEEIHVKDKNTQELLSVLRFPKEIGRVNDVDWVASDKLALSIADGYITITDSNMKAFMSPLTDLPLAVDASLHSILPVKESRAQRLLMLHQPWQDKFQVPEKANITGELRRFLESDRCSLAERCLLVAYEYGDKFSIDFWTLALFYLKKRVASKPMDSSKEKSNPVSPGTISDLDQDLESLLSFSPIPSTEKENTTANAFVPANTSNQLETNYDIFMEHVAFKRNELARVQLQDSKKFGIETRIDCAKRYILLGKADRAIHLLLESEAESSTFYSDSLRACLLATVRSSSTSQSTIKLVATSLIAHGKLSEGVELLCLIDKSLDACRYLQTYGLWNEAIWLAKVTLSLDDSADVISRWITDHLCYPSVNEKDKALLAALSIGDFMKVIEILYSMQCFSTTAMFIECCTQLGLLENNDKTTPVVEAVNHQYARILKSVNLLEAAVHYCKKSGEQGRQLLNELELQISST